MGRKGILVNDPLVAQMNPTQWVWEAESLTIHEEDRVEEMKAIFDVVKSTLINLLGLNLNPIDDESGRLRLPKDNEIIPMAIWCGNEEVLKEVLDRNKQLLEQEKIEEDIQQGTADPASEMTPEELDDLMNDFGDISFDDDDDVFKRLEWDSDEAKTMRKQLIHVRDDLPAVNKRAKVKIQEIDEEDDEPFKNPTNPVVESDDGE